MDSALGQWLYDQGVLGGVLAVSLYVNFKMAQFIVNKLLGIIERSAENNQRMAAALEEASKQTNG